MKTDATVAAGATKPALYALVYITSPDEGSPNLRQQKHAVRVYSRCAALLQKSAERNGHSVTIVTNDAAVINRETAAAGCGLLKVMEHKFEELPRWKRQFRGAYRKLEVLRLLSEGQCGEYVGLLDVDMVFLGAPDFARHLAPDNLLIYDITSQMEPESGGRCYGDLALMAPSLEIKPRWYGGELIVAHHRTLASVLADLDDLKARFVANVDRLYHSGDETVTTAAINLAAQQGLKVTDAGSMGLISRWWIYRRPFRQPALAALGTTALVHLPGDKEFLAGRRGRYAGRRPFLRAYWGYAFFRILGRKMVSLVEFLRYGKSRSNAPAFFGGFAGGQGVAPIPPQRA